MQELGVDLDIDTRSNFMTSNGQLKHSNCILLSMKKDPTFIVPVYMYFKFKNIMLMDFQKLNCEMNVTLRITIKTKNLPSKIVELMKSQIVLMFSRDESIKLTDPDLIYEESQNQSEKQGPLGLKKKISKHEMLKKKLARPSALGFTVRKRAMTMMEPYILFTPFEIIDLILTIHLRELVMKGPNQENLVTVNFNIMDRSFDEKQSIKKMAFSSEKEFGGYILAERRMETQFTQYSSSRTLVDLGNNIYNCRSCDNKRQKSIIENKEQIEFLRTQKTYRPDFTHIPHFSYAHFHVPVSKRPIATLGTIFFPLWLLGVINLAIFYQEQGLADRIANIATLMIAFIGIIPMIRQQVPPNPKFTIIEIMVYLQIGTTMICLLSSFQVNYITQDQFQKYDPLNDPLFYWCLIINLIEFVLPIIMYIYYLIAISPHNHLKEIERKKISANLKEYLAEWKDNEEANETMKIYYRYNKKTFFVEDTRGFKKQRRDLSSKYDLDDDLYASYADLEDRIKFLQHNEGKVIQKAKQMY